MVQHEYAHQVDYFLLTNAARDQLFPQLGGKCWFATCVASHDQLASERFASTLAWSYWPVSANILKPAGANDESAAMQPAAFRAAMTQLLGVQDTGTVKQAAPAGNTWSSAKPKPKPKKKPKTRKP
jgi:hypothetical protein